MSTNELGARGAHVRRRNAHRLTILAVFAAILTGLLAWNALLVYAIARMVGVFT